MSASYLSQPPGPSEFAPYYASYVAHVPAGAFRETFVRQADTVATFFAQLDPALAGHRYAPGKWTVRQVGLHMIDTERVFGYRALRFGRGDLTSLPGFDENTYADAVADVDLPLADLGAAFKRARLANVDLLDTFDEAAVMHSGDANGKPMSVRAILHVMVGHAAHHLEVIRTRYL